MAQQPQDVCSFLHETHRSLLSKGKKHRPRGVKDPDKAPGGAPALLWGQMLRPSEAEAALSVVTVRLNHKNYSDDMTPVKVTPDLLRCRSLKT